MSAVNAETMESRLRSLGTRERFVFPQEAIPESFRRSAVLIAFWREGDELYVVLTVRASKLRTQSGMVAFPGGALDPRESPAEAAVREAHEEVGLDPTSVEVLGLLDDAWSGANHHVVPVVAWVDRVPQFVANPDEVARIIVAPVAELLRPELRGTQTVRLGTLACVKATIDVCSHRVYGLTADLLIEAVGWACGEEPEQGPVRLRELEAFNASGHQPPRL